jgi:hypothetical protein
MRVYALKPDLKQYCLFAVEGALPSNFYWEFDGRRHAAGWKTLTISAADEDDTTAPLPDFAAVGVLPAFSVRAAEALLPLLQPNGELLPLRHRRAEYMLYNVTTVAHVLDEGASAVTRFTGSGRVMSVERFMFDSVAVQNLHVFRIPQLLRGHMFVTDAFVGAVEANRLTGFNLVPVWSR